MAITRVDLDSESIASEIGNLTAAQLDELPFGAIQLDPAGIILTYNKGEEKLAGRKAEEVIGRNFFQEVAPCTRVKRFYGSFQTGVERRELNEVFDFTFHFPQGKREVRIRMIYSAAAKPAVWIFVTPL